MRRPINVRSFNTTARKRQAQSWSIRMRYVYYVLRESRAIRYGAIVGEDAQA
jgi:hypothetical protein